MNNNNISTFASTNQTIQNNMLHTPVVLLKNGSQYIPVQQEDFVKFTLEKKPATPNSQKFDWSKVQIVPHVEYYQMQNGQYIKIQDYYPPVKAEIENYDGTKKDTVYHTLFGPLYRGWGQFAYNNHDSLDVRSACIDVSKLTLPSIYLAENANDIDTNVFYIKDEIGGFAIHIMKK